MDIEQLKLILEALEGVGEGAWWIALLWIAKGYFTAILTAAVFIALAAVGARVTMALNKNHNLVMQLASKTPGIVQSHTYLYDSEREKIREQHARGVPTP